MFEITTPFQWGTKGRKMTPEAIERERELIESLQQSVGDTSPVGHWTQGAGRVVDAITGKIRSKRADASEQMGLDSADDYIANDPVLASLLGGGSVSFASKTPSLYAGAAPVSSAIQPSTEVDIIASDTMDALGLPQTNSAEYIKAGLVKRGLPEHVADGFIMNMQDESGLNPGINEIAPLVPGSRGGYGLYQLTGPRRVAYEAFAQDRGASLDDVDTQLDFLMHELGGSESAAAREILATSDSGQAGAAIVNKFLRPAAEHRASRTARYTGGRGVTTGAGEPREVIAAQNAGYTPQQNAGVVEALSKAMSNPWVAKKYGPVISALMDRQMKRDDMAYEASLRQQDPMYQAQLAALTNPQPDLTSAQREYEMAKQQGFEGSFLDYKTALAEAGRAQTNVTTNVGGENEFAKAFAKGDAATISSVAETGLAAQRNIGRIDQLENLLAQSPSGFSAWTKQAAGEWGVNTEGLSDIQSAQALINSLVPEQRQPGSGPMSDADLELFKQSLPRIINTPEGNATIIRTMRAIAQYDAQGAVIVQRLRSGEITRAEAFAELQARENPLAGFKAPSSTETPTESDGVPTYNPETGKWE